MSRAFAQHSRAIAHGTRGVANRFCNFAQRFCSVAQDLCNGLSCNLLSICTKIAELCYVSCSRDLLAGAADKSFGKVEVCKWQILLQVHQTAS